MLLDTLEIIIKWLQVKVLVNTTEKAPQAKNPICVQGLGSERPSGLYDRFQGELLRLKKKSSSSTLDLEV